MSSTQPMLGLALEPTIAMRRGEAYVAQCTCGALLAVPIPYGRLAPHQLGDCPACGKARGWSQQHVPVGPFTAHWAFFLTSTVVELVKLEPGQHPQLEQALEQAKVSTQEYAVWREGA